MSGTRSWFLVSGALLAAVVAATTIVVYFLVIAPDKNTKGASDLKGETYRVELISNAWKTYRDPVSGFSVRYPAEWIARSSPGVPKLSLYPPGSDTRLPVPNISLTYRPDITISRTRAYALANKKQIIVNGSEGIQYEDSQEKVPSQGGYVEFPYRNGIMYVSATMGPGVNLVPQMLEIVKTLKLP